MGNSIGSLLNQFEKLSSKERTIASLIGTMLFEAARTWRAEHETKLGWKLSPLTEGAALAVALTIWQGEDEAAQWVIGEGGDKPPTSE